MSIDADNATPLITTIIPTFRRPRLLRRAIASALEQNGVSLQVCVYDNASGDKTADVVSEIAKHDTRLIYYCHHTNIGAIANFDFGMSHVNTPYFSLLSDDDYLLPDFYRQALAGLEAHPTAMCWAGVTLRVDERGLVSHARVLDWPREGVFEPPGGFMNMLGGMAPTWTGIVFRREVLARVGLLDREVLGPADLEYCLRLAAKFPFVLEKYPAAVFTLVGETYSTTQPMSSFWPGWKRMLRKFEDGDILEEGVKRNAMMVLRRDAQRMLFRRGANALAAARLDFARDAAQALEDDCGLPGRARLLRTIASACESSSLAQRAYTFAYRMAERRIVRAQSGLQAKYGSLLKPV